MRRNARMHTMDHKHSLRLLHAIECVREIKKTAADPYATIVHNVMHASGKANDHSK